MRFAAVSFFAVAALALVGCGSTPETTRTELPAVGNVGNVGKATPDGAPRHSIACSGANWADCYEKAAAACPNTGYVVVGHESSNASAGGTGSRNMHIECKEYSPR
jgi:hypothetical protein